MASRTIGGLTTFNDSAALAVVDEYRHDFEALREHFLSSHGQGRIGMTWCPWVPVHRAGTDNRRVCPSDIADLVRAAANWLEAFDHEGLKTKVS